MSSLLYSTSKPKIAVIGSGISGLASAWLLRNQCQVTLFEANDYLGGHTHTVDINVDGISAAVDTGFLVYNDHTYPNLIRFFEHLKVETHASDMSFSVSTPEVQWAGTDLNSLFGERGNLLSFRFWKFIGEILRFNREAPRSLQVGQLKERTLGEFLRDYSEDFRKWYLLPMAESIWSTPRSKILDFPASTFIQFCLNHGLLKIFNRPRWSTVRGGARTYVNKIAHTLSDIRLSTPVDSIRRTGDQVMIRSKGTDELFDAVICAVRPPTLLKILSDPTNEERQLFSKVSCEDNLAVLHLDRKYLPTQERFWCAWNFRGASPEAKVTLTYWLNKLQPIPISKPVLLTLNPDQEIADDLILGRFQYEHPIFRSEPINLSAIQGIKKTWYCGAWNGYGFHEDGLRSAIRVAKDFGVTPPWGDLKGDFG